MEKEAKITVHPSFEIGEISPRLFSTFLEPIGTMVNGTMYNPKHPTADEQGFRKDVIEALKSTDMPAIRLPGGNFVSACREAMSLPAGTGRIPSDRKNREKYI